MIIAERLRKENIVEYILYMWQVEDIIRAYGCQLSRIREQYISRFEISDPEVLEDMIDWYGNLIRMINEEGKRQNGHLTINQILVQDLGDLCQQLLASPKFPFFNAEYYKVLPFIVELRQKARNASKMQNAERRMQNEELSEIETCLNALYGVMMLRLQKKEVSLQTQNAVKEITTFLGMLSDYYIKDKTEGLKFYDD